MNTHCDHYVPLCFPCRECEQAWSEMLTSRSPSLLVGPM